MIVHVLAVLAVLADYRLHKYSFFTVFYCVRNTRVYTVGTLLTSYYQTHIKIVLSCSTLWYCSSVAIIEVIPGTVKPIALRKLLFKEQQNNILHDTVCLVYVCMFSQNFAAVHQCH